MSVLIKSLELVSTPSKRSEAMTTTTEVEEEVAGEDVADVAEGVDAVEEEEGVAVETSRGNAGTKPFSLSFSTRKPFISITSRF